MAQESSKQVDSVNKVAIFKTTCDSLPTDSMISVHLGLLLLFKPDCVSYLINRVSCEHVNCLSLRKG